MKSIKLIFAFLIIVLSQSYTLAQDDKLNILTEKIDKFRVCAELECKIELDFTLDIKAKIICQQNCYYAKNEALEIYCDGRSRWTIDHEGKEVYIENSSGIQELAEFTTAVKELKIKKAEFLPLSDDMSAFVPNLSNLGKEWIITDLRQE